MAFSRSMLLGFSVFILAAPVIVYGGDSKATAYSKAVIENCHAERTDVRIWVSRSGGVWKDHGLLKSQQTDAGCPGKGTPKTIELERGGFWVVKAIDARCGGAGPINTLAKCHVLTTPRLSGDASSPELYTARVDAAR